MRFMEATFYFTKDIRRAEDRIVHEGIDYFTKDDTFASDRMLYEAKREDLLSHLKTNQIPYMAKSHNGRV